jgi:putative phage-type endonuclease
MVAGIIGGRMIIETREQWLEERKKGIGASESSAIVGMNPYKTNVQLWEEKTGRRQMEDISHKSFVRYGIEAESHLRELFALDYPQYAVDYNEFKLHKNSKHPFIFATLDGELTDKETGETGVLEIKTTNILQSMQREKWNERIPENYYIQVLHQLLATGWDFVILKAHLKTEWGNEIRINTKHYTIKREDVLDDIEYLKYKEIKFWNYVLIDKKPNLLLPNI